MSQTTDTAAATDDREYARTLIAEMPKGATLHDIEYRVGVAALLRDRSKKVDEVLAMGIDEATKRGLLITQEEMERRFPAWTDSSDG